ncbi:Uncharacterized protein APZ42_031802 [Daphnia magna]|uniref:DUF4806 domain-containing protein n=1 Tax=Daphnia magna TaxID=35525 RepID=A0A164MII0_9CRUS|nr:Uncharacterized protein APZ42_031802 [Daphnia magna]
MSMPSTSQETNGAYLKRKTTLLDQNRYLRVMVRELADIEAKQRDLRRLLLRKQSLGSIQPNNGEYRHPVFQKHVSLPLKAKYDFQHFEEKLLKHDVQNNLLEMFFSFFEKNVEDTVRKIWREMMSNELMQTYTWSGTPKPNSGKEKGLAVKGSRLLHAVTEAVKHGEFGNTSIPQLSLWLREVTGSTIDVQCIVCRTKKSPMKIIKLSNMGGDAILSHAKGKNHLRNIDQRKRVESVKSVFIQPVTPAKIVQDHPPPIEIVNAELAPQPAVAVRTHPSSSFGSIAAPDLNKSSLFIIKDAVTKAELLWIFKNVTSFRSKNSSSDETELFQTMFPASQVAQKFYLSIPPTKKGLRSLRRIKAGIEGSPVEQNAPGSSCGLHVLFCALSSGHNKVNWEVHAALLLGILLV